MLLLIAHQYSAVLPLTVKKDAMYLIYLVSWGVINGCLIPWKVY